MIANRNNQLFFVCFLLFSFLTVGCSHQSTDRSTDIPSILFDTDIGPDYDDVGALSILHAMADRGEVKILATVASNRYEGIASIIDIFNTYWKRPNLPIGVPKDNAPNQPDPLHWVDTLLARYPHTIQSNRDASDAVTLYRKILTEEPDTSVTVVTVGFLNNLRDLLASGPDQYSDLDGKTLIKKKVKLLVSMAGRYPSGREFNIFNDAQAAQDVFEHWPTKVIFSGFEIGMKIKTGLPLAKDPHLKGNPAQDVFRIGLRRKGDEEGRMSWDEVTTLVAVRGDEPYFSLQQGKVKILDDGSNEWQNGEGNQYYLVEKVPLEKIREIIDDLMLKMPQKGATKE